jgi:methylenetetrahydrofolate reductase (NADPH)
MTEQKISIEFFPPKTEQGLEKLHATVDALLPLQPEYFSVTYGAGGSTRHQTQSVVSGLVKRGLVVAPHLSFGADSEEAVGALLQAYKDEGINRLVALRGDLPSGMGQVKPVYANELVEFIRTSFGDWFHISVACYPEVHPQAVNFDSDIQYLKNKLDAGSDAAVTQYFYNLEAFLYFRDRCKSAGIEKPIYPGVMPIVNADNLIRFSEACGADIPRWLRKGMDDCANQDDLIRFGEDVVTNLCVGLLAEGVPGLHFYSMNQSRAVLNICERLTFSA